MAVERDDEPLELLRLRRVVSDRYAAVLVALLLVGCVGAWAGYAPHLDPGTRTEERTTATWTRSADFDHGAEVTTENPVYETGVELRNQRAYFPRISPFLTGQYRVGYAASDGGRVDVAVDLTLLVRSQGDDVVFWGYSRDLNETVVTDIAPDRSVAVDYRVNLSRAQGRIERAEATLGDSPGDPEVLVEAETRVTGDINGRTVDRTFVDTLRLRPDGDAFGVRDPGELTNSSATTRTVEVTRTYSSVRRVGGPLAALVGFGSAAGLVVARRRDLLAPSPADLDRLVREEYGEWLSRGSLPASVGPDAEDVVEVAALVDLVDVAVDTDERVLYDPARDLYAVLGERHTYVCRPPLAAGTVGPAMPGEGEVDEREDEPGPGSAVAGDEVKGTEDDPTDE
jgi:hypothetical protein